MTTLSLQSTLFKFSKDYIYLLGGIIATIIIGLIIGSAVFYYFNNSADQNSGLNELSIVQSEENILPELPIFSSEDEASEASQSESTAESTAFVIEQEPDESFQTQALQNQQNQQAANQPEVGQAFLSTAEADIILTLEVVRIDEDGNLLVAGQAKPYDEVNIYVGATLLGSSIPEEDYSFSFFYDSKLDPGEYLLKIEGINSAGRDFSNEQVFFVIPENGMPSAVGLSDQDSQIIQLGENQGNLSVDLLEYDDKANLMIQGSYRASDGHLMVYLDNDLIGDTRLEDSGSFNEYYSVKIERNILPGSYELRVDLLEEGAVIERRSVLYEKFDSLLISSDGKQIVVSPGNSLWRIARRVYNRGALYTIIYERNQSQILDPNIIFPGQVFILPDREDKNQKFQNLEKINQ